MPRLVRFAWLTLGWNLVVILLGAVVRATGSGAGCGRSWPVCRGELVPGLEGATAVEFTHRVTSGLALVLTGLLVVGVFRATASGHPARAGVVASGISILGEALIGAAIVLFEWVADDASVARVVSVPFHLVNTLILLAGLTLTVFWLRGGGSLRRGDPRLRPLVLVGAGLAVIAATGAITALADTLFPKDAFTLSGAASISGGEHFLTRLRVLHPIVAVVIGVVAASWAGRRALPEGGEAGRAALVVVGAVLVQVVAGSLNVVLLTPLWLSIFHLLVADVLWIAWVWMGAGLLSGPVPAPVVAAARE